MIDMHCHLDLYPHPHDVATECHTRGMFVLSVTTTPSAWPGTRALAQNKSSIQTALGLHPQLAAERRSEISLFDEYLSDTKFVAEIGLDGAPEHKPAWKQQLDVFQHILKSCCDTGGKLMSIHSRRAATPVLDHLKRFNGAGTAVFHWFSGSVRELNRAIEMGCWFSVGPTMLRSKSGAVRAARMPRDRVLTETDGPFAQWNGHSILPWEVESAFDLLAKTWDLPRLETEHVIRDNLSRLLSSLD